VYPIAETDFQDIVHDLDSEEDDGGLEIVMPWLQNLHSQVRTCQFTAFWKEFNSSSEGANGKLRHSVSRRVQLTISLP
jgi:hypothetical protein